MARIIKHADGASVTVTVVPGVKARTVTLDAADAARLGVTGEVIDGKVTVETDARPRSIRLGGVSILRGRSVKIGSTVVPYADLIALFEANGWTTLPAMFPADGSEPAKGSKYDPAERDAMLALFQSPDLDWLVDASGTAGLDL